MRIERVLLNWSCLSISVIWAIILQNGQLRLNAYPGQAPLIPHAAGNSLWRHYAPSAPEISYQGRWDNQYISSPGLRLEFTGHQLALSFGQHTDPGVLIAYRLGRLDWQFSNVTGNSTYQFIGPWTPGINGSIASEKKSFELRGESCTVQISGVAVAADGKLSQIQRASKTVEVIGDSLSIGQYATYEGLSSWAYAVGAGLQDVEYSITAYSGICVHDRECWGNHHGQVYQWYRTCDSSPRARRIYGANPPRWDFGAHAAADLVIINLGANDDLNGVSSTDLVSSYITLIDGVHSVWPDAHIVIMSLWGDFVQRGLTFVQAPQGVREITTVYQHYRDQGKGYVHFFETSGIFKHGDIAQDGHLNDMGNAKLASHLMQWISSQFGWTMDTDGAEILHGTQYWNTEGNY
ncbi:GDSL-like Lipase/Acylhydrolase-like protein [Aspergillus campestris IBT 28561]|uniref:GDSL-like Lipase/Acylhydrolase-like protein n=1 Tax=Aspergillus campestris (strain IBT 28561) TaxID=1392248 RepID=A0A2I1D549_ASPC2|nr:GDSL-like Lipase/Acylhydrolase-like protein [Aspergillus campestris IBT 28561]PKY05002.1 GDSL-like Lipase/Acylhydrolase-like protein [Aspergillus campestris IBT 28561]